MSGWLKALVSFGLLALLFIVLPWTDLREAIGRLPLAVWAAVLACFLAGHALGAAKWRLMINVSGAGLDVTDAFRCYGAGLFANICLPTIVGGDVLRATLGARSSRRPEAVVLGSVADRIIDTAALGGLAVAGVILAGRALPERGRWIGLATLVGTGLVVSAVAAILLRRPLRRWPARIRRPLGRALASLRRLARRPGIALVAASIALTMQSGFVLLNAWIGRSIGIDVGLSVWFLVWPLAKIAGLLPVSLGGLGVRDATLGGLLAPAGVPVAFGVVASLIWQTIVISGGLVAGLLWWGLGGSRRTKPGADAASAAATSPSPGRYA